MQHIIGLSGKSQSGKNTVCNFISACILNNIGCIDGFHIDETGFYIKEPGAAENDFIKVDLQSMEMNFVRFAMEKIWPYVKIYSVADLLKQNICMPIFGMTWEQCYGEDTEKETLTKLRWENMPQPYEEGYIQLEKSGPMTARDVMQYVGTEIFRRMIPTVWIDSLLSQIKNDASELALICDIRFPDEVQAVQAVGGKVIRLTRDPKQGTHSSETVLDNYTGYDATIDNKDMDFDQQHKEAYQLMKTWGILP